MTASEQKMSVQDVIAAVRATTAAMRRSADLLDSVVDYYERDGADDEPR